jgi:hypothetical protein
MRILLTLALSVSLVFAAELPVSAPEQLGFSRERLQRIHTVMQEHVAAGDLAGASGLVARNGKIVFRENWGEMKADSIVRMYSMTKAVTGVAAMILYEEGKFSLTDPVSKYMPEFSNMRVARLFRHTTGFDYSGPIDETGETAYKKLDMVGGAPQVSFDLAEAVRRLATAPLLHRHSGASSGSMFRQDAGSIFRRAYLPPARHEGHSFLRAGREMEPSGHALCAQERRGAWSVPRRLRRRGSRRSPRCSRAELVWFPPWTTTRVLW